ncbi:MAG: hypothetical protein AAB553_07330 [Patescibacteria group bacterium]
MREKALWLYDVYHPVSKQFHHPKIDDMFPRRDLLEKRLREGRLSLGVDIGVIYSRPGKKRNTVPETIIIAQDPRFDKKGNLVSATYRPDRRITEYPVVIDHAIHFFRYPGPDGDQPEQAWGVGIDPNRAINAPTVQQYGNDKEAAIRDILEPLGVTVKSYTFNELEAMADAWKNNAVIIKHNSESQSKNIQVVPSMEAIPELKKNKNYVFQPYLNLKGHIPGLVPLTQAYASQLEAFNPNDPREINPCLKEVRMHFFIRTKNGKTVVDAFPTLSTSDPGAEYVTRRDWTPLDPDAFRERYPHVYNGTIKVARKLIEQAGVQNAYGVADWGIGTHKTKEKEIMQVIIDFNCRGPYLVPDLKTGRESLTPTQQEFTDTIEDIAETALQAA